MAKRSDFIGLAVLTVVFSYALTVGATFNGIFGPEFHPLSLGMLLILTASWLWLHWHGNWRWHRTSLDTVFLLWGLAFGLSLVANTDAWRRIAIGLWYMGLYIGLWYMLHDLIANRALSRIVIVDALLITGFFIMLFGLFQLQIWLRQVLATGVLVAPPRPSSVFGNPNFLSDFLIVLIPLTLSRWFMSHTKPAKIVFGLTTVLQMTLLLLTDSRGAWIGIAVGLPVWVVLVAARNGRLTPAQVADWWKRQTIGLKTAVILGVVASIVGVLGGLLYISRSFADPSRSAGLRTEIYTAAIRLFAEKPITGQGLFTFGRGLVRLPDVHPDKPHSHAHDAPLHIAAELGIVGLAALVVTLFVGYRTIRQNWQVSTAHERLLLVGATAAVVAFGVHQLTDVPAMMPAIALTGLLALVLALSPAQPEAVNPSWSRFGHPVEMVGIWAAVIITGFWNSGIYTGYMTVLRQASDTAQYRQAAEQLQPIINADPSLSLYYLEQGFLYGMAASEGDGEAARAGIAAYEHFIQLDAGYALAWVNVAALHWQLGEREVAVDALQQAIRLDAVEWNYEALLGRYAEAMGNTAAAKDAYTKALMLYPDASLYTELDLFVSANPSAVDFSQMTITAQVVRLMEAGQVAEAKALWVSDPTPESAPNYVVQSLLALASGETDAAAAALSTADQLAVTPIEQAWVHVGKARLARQLGSAGLVESELDAAAGVLVQQPLAADDETLINIANAQFLQATIERQYLPQVDYRKDPVLLYLLDRSG